MICFAGLLAATVSVNAAGRVALVIGNASYKHAAVLDNPANDANDIAAALEKQNFKVIKGIDLDHAGMLATIREFSRALNNGDVGVFFYAGHGIQIRGKNYLVPTDAKLADSFGIDFELVRLERIHQAMEQSAKLNIIFLDACRNNPIARNLARSMGTRSATVGNGLAAMESGIGSLISFSTQPGNVAVDGRGMRNSPYSAALAKYISQGDGDITEILIKVRREVMAATSQQQVPWEHSALTQQFYFNKPAKSASSSNQSAKGSSAPSAMTFQQRAELAYWNSVKDSGDADLLRSYLDQYPSGAFAALAKVLLARSAKATSPSTGKTVTKDAVALAGNAAKTSKITPESSETPIGRLSAKERRRRSRLLRLRANRRAAEQMRKANGQAMKAATKPVETAGLNTTRGVKPAAAAVAVPKNALVRRAESYRAIQRQLLRLNCLTGEDKGRWSARSHLALRRAYGDKPAPSASDMLKLTAATAKSVLATLNDGKTEACRP